MGGGYPLPADSSSGYVLKTRTQEKAAHVSTPGIIRRAFFTRRKRAADAALPLSRSRSPPRPQHEDMENLAGQIRRLKSLSPKTTTYETLVLRDAWVEWDDFIPRSKAHLDDIENQIKLKLAPAADLAMLAGDAALLALSGQYTPHQRAGQLDTLVVDGNPAGVKCIYPTVGSRAPNHPPGYPLAPTCGGARQEERGLSTRRQRASGRNERWS